MMGLRLICYARVSTDDQASRGVSLEAQVERCRSFCDFMGHELVGVVTDSESGRSFRRRGIQGVLADLFDGRADGVVVYALDRFIRSTLDFLQMIDRFEHNGVHFVSLREQIDSSTPHGKFMMTVFAAMAQMERELVSSRTKESIAKLRRDGKVYGTPPYGWRRQGDDLVRDPEQQEGLAYISNLLDRGYSFGKVAKNLNRLGYRSARGVRWTGMTVSFVARRNGMTVGGDDERA